VSWRQQAVVEGALSGVVGAMAMSGLRSLTKHLGALRRSPPERVVDAAAPEASGDARVVVQELAHWGFGAACGAVYGTLPAGLRRSPVVGVIYGLGVWAFFETVMRPMLGPAAEHRRPVAERLSLIADHALFGLVLWAGPPPREGD
jgi:hypothetical protein